MKKTINQQTKEIAIFCALLGASCVIASQLSGCGNAQTLQIVPGPTVTVSPSPTDAVQSIVDDYNSWRSANGQESIDPGLTCTLYTVPQTTTGITATANGGTAPVLTNVGAFTYQGVFNQTNASVSAGLNVLPAGMQSVYQSWFIMKCTGYLVITSDDYYAFNTVSDDGSNLYVDGALVTPNDGLHGAQSSTGTKHLQDTVHTFELDFFQANGSEELVVNMNNSLLPAENLWH